MAYRDGRNQEAIADKFQIEDKFIVFYTNGVPSLVVAADLVEHIAYESALEPE